MSDQNPIVSIGLPVFNGDRYLKEAMESILAQTYADLELVVCDNASTDGTEDIVQYFCKQDSRVRYFRNPENIGAAPNYNLSFEKSCGRYFKWAAHDDLCAPEFIKQCVAVLEQHSDAILAFPKVAVIDHLGEFIKHVENKLDTANPKPEKRFAALLGKHVITEIFGLIRRDALVNTRLIAPFPSSDRMLLCELAIKGSFQYIEEPLFIHRDHDDRSHKRLKTAHERAAWFSTQLANKRIFPAWRFLGECLDIIGDSTLTRPQKRACYMSLLRWSKRNRSRLFGDLSSAISIRKDSQAS